MSRGLGERRAFAMVCGGYPPAAQAGMERGCERLAAALVRRGHCVAVLTSAVPGTPDVVDEQGVIVHRVLRPRGPGPLWGVSYRRQVRRWLTVHLADWDVVMCHQLYLHSMEANQVAHAHGRLACHLLVAAQTYSDVARLLEVRGGRWMLRRAVDEADVLFVLSEQSRQELLAVGADARRIHDYRYFVDVARFSPGGEPPERELLCLGRWHPQKNLPLLLDAFERLGGRVHDIRLRLVGAGPTEDMLRARVAASPFSDRVRIEGWSSDPVPLYRRAWALVMSSDAEGLSNVMIEAMSCGTPVVTTDVSGAREALDLRGERRHPLPAHGHLRGVGGLIVPRGDVEALTSALQAVATTSVLRDELSGLARARVVAEFSEDRCVDGFLERLDA